MRVQEIEKNHCGKGQWVTKRSGGKIVNVFSKNRYRKGGCNGNLGYRGLGRRLRGLGNSMRGPSGREQTINWRRQEPNFIPILTPKSTRPSKYHKDNLRFYVIKIPCQIQDMEHNATQEKQSVEWNTNLERQIIEFPNPGKQSIDQLCLFL